MTSVIEKIVKEGNDTANTYGKLTALYQVLNFVQTRINELQSELEEKDLKSK
mgnify:CR=1 FL=1